MSAITDYGALLIDAGEYSGALDIAQVFPRLIGLAEAKLNRSLRVGEMEKTDTLTLVNGDVALFDDFLEARIVTGPAGQALNAWSIGELDARYRSNSGYPQGYTVVGNTIKVRPTSNGVITVTYYAAIPPLTPVSPTNWLLTKAPDVYLYGLCEEIAIWKKDADGVAAARGLKDQAIRGLNLLDERRRWGNSQVVVDGCTP